MKSIYLDNNATTPLDPRVLEAMLVDFQGPAANPSSPHSWGREAKKKLDQARKTVSDFFSLSPEEIYFTSGGSESINLFLRGLPDKTHLITSKIEHSCLYKTVQELEKTKDLRVTYLPVGSWGAPLIEDLEKALTSAPTVIALSSVNGETGVKLDVAPIAYLAEERNIPFFIDAVAHIGKEPFTLFQGISAVALSAHKFHGPKGVGALLLRSRSPKRPLITGGEQERGLRAGTENLAGILGLAKALEILEQEQTQITEHLIQFQDLLETRLREIFPSLQIHGKGPRIPNTSMFGFEGIDGETLLIQLDLAGIAVSLGSACASGGIEPSRTLLEMGISRKLARSSLRFSWSRMNRLEEIDPLIDVMARLFPQFTSLSPKESSHGK